MRRVAFYAGVDGRTTFRATMAKIGEIVLRATHVEVPFLVLTVSTRGSVAKTIVAFGS